MTTLVNLTPHDIVIYPYGSSTGSRTAATITIPACGQVARLEETATPEEPLPACGHVERLDDDSPAGPLSGIPMARVALGQIVGMPEPYLGTIYIVSMPLIMGMRAAGIDRPDVVYPYGQIRNSAGRIIGCRSLARLA